MANNFYNIARISEHTTKAEGTITISSPPVTVSDGIIISTGKITVPDVFIENQGIVELKRIYIKQYCEATDTLFTGDLKIFIFDNDDDLSAGQGSSLVFDANTTIENLVMFDVLNSSGWQSLPGDSSGNSYNQIDENYTGKYIDRATDGNSLGFVLVAGGTGTLNTHKFFYKLFFGTKIK